MDNIKAFWERKDLYKNENGDCWYLTICKKKDCKRNPAECELFEAFLDGECAADENNE